MINNFLAFFIGSAAYFFTKNMWNVLKNKSVEWEAVFVSSGFLVGMNIYSLYNINLEAMISTLKLEIALIFLIAGGLSFLDCSKNTKMLREAEICFGTSNVIFSIVYYCLSEQTINLHPLLGKVFLFFLFFASVLSGGFIFLSSRNE